LTPKDEKDTPRDSSLEDGLVVYSPEEEATGKDDRCVTISQENPLVQDLVMGAEVDTMAVVRILGTEQYGSLGCRPPIKY
jgi:hypothetical protein